MKLGSVIEGTDPFPSKPNVLSEFAERFDTWVEDGKLEEKTKKFYRNGWRLLKATPVAVLLVARAVFRSLAERAGLEFAAHLSEDDYYAAIHDPELWHPLRSFSVVARRLILPTPRPVYQIIEKHWEPGRTVVAAPGFAFGARIAQEKLGVPLATVHLQPIMLRSAIQPGCFGFPDILGYLPCPLRRLYLRAADQFLIDPLVADETNCFRLELGLLPVRRLFNGWVQSPQLVIGLFPDWFAPPAPDWPSNVALTGFPLWDEGSFRNPPLGFAEFLSGGPPPIVFTAGSAMGAGRTVFPSVGRGVPNLWTARNFPYTIS